MSTADLFVEAINTAVTLIHAVYGWLIVFATVAAILILAAIACGAWAVDAVLDRLCGRQEVVQPFEVEPEPDDTPKPPQRRTARRAPAWAHTDHHDHEWNEAA